MPDGGVEPDKRVKGSSHNLAESRVCSDQTDSAVPSIILAPISHGERNWRRALSFSQNQYGVGQIVVQFQRMLDLVPEVKHIQQFQLRDPCQQCFELTGVIQSQR